jgi:hypothetical protein
MVRDTSFLLEKYGWSIIDQLDNWVYIYDGLPPKLKLFADFKIQGMSNKEAAKLMKITLREANRKEQEIKKRFLRGENIL